MLKNFVKRLINQDYFVVGDNYETLTHLETKKLIQILSMIISSSKYGNRIAIYLPRNYMYLVSILSVWFAKKCFIPLNQNWPKKYIIQILNDSKVKTVLTEKKFFFLKKFNQFVVKKDFLIKKKVSKKFYKTKNKSAYIIYTSGSTGKPKGVLISNLALESYIKWLDKKFYNEKRLDLSLLITGEITFDIVIADLSFALSRQVSIYITPDNKNVLSAIKLLGEKPINVIYTVPSFMEKLIHANKIFKKKFKNINYVFCGGEVFKKKLYFQIKEVFYNSKIYNMYGPTECTINCLAIELSSISKLKEYKVLPTGKSFDHLDYRLERNGKNSPKEGELYIGGAQLMNGYINTEQKKNGLILIKNKKYYATGDYFVKKKNIYYFQGRINEIKKISGHRLNLNYIENIIDKLNFIVSNKIIIDKEKIVCFAISKIKEKVTKKKNY